MRALSVGVALMCVMASAEAADIPGTNGVPDLTKGGELTRINKRWVGPVGIYCGSWRPRGQKMTDVRQLLVLEVEKGSPADGILEVGDVVLGADGTGAAEVPLFEGAPWAMMPIANAITEAEARYPALLKLLIWRPAKKAKEAPAGGTKPPTLDDIDDLDDLDAGVGNPLAEWGAKPEETAARDDTADGRTTTVTIKLETLGRYSDTAPYNCAKSRKVLRKGVKALYESNEPGKTYLGALCLLAADDPANPDNDKHQARAKEWIYKLVEEESFGNPWHSGPKLIVLSEYYMKTRDAKVFPTLVKRAEEHASGVSWIGTSGHRWADKLPDGSRGRISGYGAINCSGVLGFLGLSLARKAGVNSPVVIAANERQRIFFGHYAEKGKIIYGEYYYGINGGTGDENGRHAMPALALGLHEGQEAKAKYFCRMATLATHSNRQYAHGGPFFGQVWQPVAAAQGGVKTANFHFKEIGWHLDLKRRWNGRRIYEGANSYSGFSPDATALLFYAAPLKQLCITGRGQTGSLQLSDAEFAETAATKTFDESKLSSDELIASLSQYLGMLRGRAAAELAKRVKETNGAGEGADIVRKLIALAADRRASPTGRGGACRALMDVKHKAQEPVATLMNAEITKTGIDMLKESDPYVRYGGARILLRMRPEDVRPYGNYIMDAILAIDRPTFPLDEENPCRWDHGVMGEVFVSKVLNQGVDGLDRRKLIPVLRSLLATPMSVARTAAARGIHNLTREGTLGIADSIIECMKSGAPFNAAGDGAAPLCQKLLAKHHFEEGLFLSLRYNPGPAIKNGIPEAYGRAALQTQSIRDTVSLVGDSMLIEAIGGMDKVMPQLLKGDGPETLKKLKAIHAVKAAAATLTLPAAKTELVVDATNYARRNEDDTTYTWRKVHGAGKVSFTPNGSSKSKTTTVAFTDKKPGTYRFEVTMSDTLGINLVRGTVDVTLYDRRGRLPRNRPPQATSQSLEAVPGLPARVTLSGTDPDGDDLGFMVTRQPAHGRLAGHGGNLTYTAELGHNGTDQLTFDAIDGQGETAAGTVDFKVSDKNVGVAVYEGFDYPGGTIINQENHASFGFSGPWKKSDGRPAKNSFLVDRGSLEKLDKNPSFSYPSLPSTGGKLTKGERHRDCVRYLDRKVLAAHKLLDNGRELWFSIFVQAPGGQGRLSFGLRGPGADLGFKIQGYGIFATHNGETAGTARNPWSRSAKLRFAQDKPNMIIGRCVWGKTDADPDTLEIYRVFDAPEFGPLVLKDPVCVLTEVSPQEKVGTVYLHSEVAVDEIRIGPTLHSVMAGTKPLTGSRSN